MISFLCGIMFCFMGNVSTFLEMAVLAWPNGFASKNLYFFEKAVRLLLEGSNGWDV